MIFSGLYAQQYFGDQGEFLFPNSEEPLLERVSHTSHPTPFGIVSADFLQN